MIDTRALQKAIDASREAATTMNEAWCANTRVDQAEHLAEAERLLVEALHNIRAVRVPVTPELRSAA
ncbi:hypothetical protein [Brevundimonas sp. GCM10030266]|uniref:hypothetical protein n=1 Tax=Brevundimonas sp. GCM10030266 TaxID=3273386 RepID=UPI00360D13F7